VTVVADREDCANLHIQRYQMPRNDAGCVQQWAIVSRNVPPKATNSLDNRILRLGGVMVEVLVEEREMEKENPRTKANLMVVATTRLKMEHQLL